MQEEILIHGFIRAEATESGVLALYIFGSLHGEGGRICGPDELLSGSYSCHENVIMVEAR